MEDFSILIPSQAKNFESCGVIPDSSHSFPHQPHQKIWLTLLKEKQNKTKKGPESKHLSLASRVTSLVQPSSTVLLPHPRVFFSLCCQRKPVKTTVRSLPPVPNLPWLPPFSKQKPSSTSCHSRVESCPLLSDHTRRMET